MEAPLNNLERYDQLILQNCGSTTNLKDGVWSAFEHHCAGSYNLPFTGFILIPIGANLLRNYYQTLSNAEKVSEFEF
jgi:hypothetical protein